MVLIIAHVTTPSPLTRQARLPVHYNHNHHHHHHHHHSPDRHVCPCPTSTTSAVDRADEKVAITASFPRNTAGAWYFSNINWTRRSRASSAHGT